MRDAIRANRNIPEVTRSADALAQINNMWWNPRASKLRDDPCPAGCACTRCCPCAAIKQQHLLSAAPPPALPPPASASGSLLCQVDPLLPLGPWGGHGPRRRPAAERLERGSELPAQAPPPAEAVPATSAPTTTAAAAAPGDAGPPEQKLRSRKRIPGVPRTRRRPALAVKASAGTTKKKPAAASRPAGGREGARAQGRKTAPAPQPTKRSRPRPSRKRSPDPPPTPPQPPPPVLPQPQPLPPVAEAPPPAAQRPEPRSAKRRPERPLSFFVHRRVTRGCREFAADEDFVSPFSEDEEDGNQDEAS